MRSHAACQTSGYRPNLIVEVCGTGAAGSWALSNLGKKIIDENYEPGFAIEHMLKDLRLVRETNQTSDKDIPGTELADCLFKAVRDMDEGKGAKQGTQATIRAYNIEHCQTVALGGSDANGSPLIPLSKLSRANRKKQ